MNRFLLLLLVPLLLVACRSTDDLAVEDPVRNVIMICADTVRYDTFFEPYQDDALQPWLDRSLRFDAAMSPAPWTIPAVGSVLTGVYPRQHGAGRLPGPVVNLMAQVPASLDPTIPTLAEQLKEQELRTAAFVSHPWFEAGYGLERGFRVLESRKGWEVLNNRMMQWLANEKPEGERFFGYLHYMEAHDFHTRREPAMSELIATASDETIEQILAHAPGPACADRESIMCRRYQAYAIRVAEMRAALADILQRLEDAGFLEETLVVFYSDHGEEFHDHFEELAALKEDPRGVFGFGHGQSLYQELIHVPFLVWHPRRPGQRIAEPVSLTDTTPSVLHWLGFESVTQPLTGLPLEFAVQGHSGQIYEQMEPSFRPAADEQIRPLYASGIGYGKERVSVLIGDEKAVYSPHLDEMQFFDLAADPLEKSPLSEDRFYYTHEPRIGDYLELEPPSESSTPELSDERLEQLKSIGYLQGVEEKKKPASQD